MYLKFNGINAWKRSVRNEKTIVIIVIAIISILGIYYRFVSDFSYLATIEGNIISAESSSSQGTFHSKGGEKIKFFLNSSVEQGTLNIKLTDLNGKVIKNFETNRNDSEEIYLDNDGEYRVSVIYDNFVGSFNVKCK
ncbi:hypothetical protein [Clostridium sp.]|uniref:hypothetical protein n=1 Tax=Clostridium sp. TaxID=1506 RepID=UPI0034640373